MNTKPERHGADVAGRGKATKRTPKPATSMVDSRGSKRVYVDLPAESVRRFNVLAAMRGIPKRELLAKIVEDAVAAAKIA